MFMTDPHSQIWDRISEQGPEEGQYFNKAWYNSWLIYTGRGTNWCSDILFEVVGNDEGVEAIMPFASQHAGPFKFKSLAGNYFPHRGIPYRGCPEVAANLVAKRLTESVSHSGVRTGPVYKNSTFFSSLINELKLANWKVLLLDTGSDFCLTLPSEIDVFLNGLSSKKRKKIRYYWKSLNRLGDAQIKHYNNVDQKNWHDLLNELSLIENSAWISTRGEPRFMGSNNQMFWQSLLEDKWFKQSINVWVMYLDRKPVSYTISIDTDLTRYVLANSYIESVKNYSTGTKLYLELITDAINQGKKIINFGLGDSGYKTAYGATVIKEQVDLFAFPPSLMGRIAYLVLKFKIKLFD